MSDVEKASTLEMKTFNDIVKYNWAWIYKSTQGVWT